MEGWETGRCLRPIQRYWQQKCILLDHIQMDSKIANDLLLCCSSRGIICATTALHAWCTKLSNQDLLLPFLLVILKWQQAWPVRRLLVSLAIRLWGCWEDLHSCWHNMEPDKYHKCTVDMKEMFLLSKIQVSDSPWRGNTLKYLRWVRYL